MLNRNSETQEIKLRLDSNSLYRHRGLPVKFLNFKVYIECHCTCMVRLFGRVSLQSNLVLESLLIWVKSMFEIVVYLQNV